MQVEALAAIIRYSLARASYSGMHCCYADSSTGSDASSTAVRGFTYQAIGQLASRVPSLFTSDVSIARRFFQSLSTEPAGVRSALQEAISTLASAYQGCTGVK